MFNVPVEANCGVEVCKLVGTYMFFLMSEKYNEKYFRVYRDVVLGVVRISVPETEKKIIQKIFEEDKLDITIQCNMEIVDYSDVSLKHLHWCIRNNI